MDDLNDTHRPSDHAVLTPDLLQADLKGLIEAIDEQTLAVQKCLSRIAINSVSRAAGNDECSQLLQQRRRLVESIGYRWLNNRAIMRFMVWNDPEHDAPADLVVFASHTPEPAEPARVSSGEVFRLKLSFQTPRWRSPIILKSVIAYELSREDAPDTVFVWPENRDDLMRGVVIEALYGISAVSARGVFYSPYLAEFVKP